VILGIVVNPKTGEPFLVQDATASAFRVHRPRVPRRLARAADIATLATNPYIDAPARDATWHMGVQREGSGDLDYEDRSYMATGFPRVHMGRVEHPGTGTGTCAYTAACLAAHLRNEGKAHDFDTDTPTTRKYGLGDGVSSEPSSRSEEAEAWWNRSLALGLTKRITRRFAMVDVYEFDSAFDHNLIACSFELPKEEARERRQPEQEAGDARRAQQRRHRGPTPAGDVFGIAAAKFVDSNRAALLGMNLTNCALEFVAVALALAERAGGTREDLRAMALRADVAFQRAHDLQEAGYAEARAALTTVSSMEPNASTGEVAEAIEEGAELRQVLGWDRLEDLP